ncbi:hypothetical protein [Novipirellula caenicola]|uniref:Uncharacterized protein n=1 Tax=Novipirellula caenicola TaxID=1536901 RepID=A0ABP9VR99_9BACT
MQGVPFRRIRPDAIYFYTERVAFIAVRRGARPVKIERITRCNRAGLAPQTLPKGEGNGRRPDDVSCNRQIVVMPAETRWLRTFIRETDKAIGQPPRIVS